MATQMYFEGGALPIAALRPEGALFTVTGTGPVLIYSFLRPTSRERQSAKTAPIELRVLKLRSIVYVLSRVGTIPWEECPYDPHLSSDVSSLRDPRENGAGFPLTFMLVDKGTCKILAIRAFTLGFDVSCRLYDEIRRTLSEPFSPRQFTDDQRYAESTYSTDDLARMALVPSEESQAPNVPVASLEVLSRPSLQNIPRQMLSVRPYPGLPAELEPFHVYVSDAGHTILCDLECFRNDAASSADDYEVPVPVKYVLNHQYKIENGHIWINAPYDNELGLIVGEEWSEF